MIEKCSGYINGQCKHGHGLNGSPLCQGHGRIDPTGPVKVPMCELEDGKPIVDRFTDERNGRWVTRCAKAKRRISTR